MNNQKKKLIVRIMAIALSALMVGSGATMIITFILQGIGG